MACAASTDTRSEFDPARPYRLSPTVSVRPEPFGALLYDFTTRRLSFLKSPQLVHVVRELEHQPDVHQALSAAEIADAECGRYLDALTGLHEAGTIQAR